MTWHMTWDELRKVPFGAVLEFADPWDIFPYCVIQAGTRCVMVEHDDETIMVLPDDAKARKALAEWDGCVQFAPRNDGYEPNDASPLALLEGQRDV